MTSCWGGRITDVSKSDGVFPWPYGVAASGLSYLGGTVKVAELQAGEINHALAVNVVHTASETQVPPAALNMSPSLAMAAPSEPLSHWLRRLVFGSA